MATASKWLGKTERGIRLSYIPELQPADVKKNRKPMLIKISAIMEVHVPRRAAERMRDFVNDPEMVGGDSVGLERYRLAKAKLAELDLATRMGDLIEVSVFRDGMARWAAVFRRMGERLAKKFGPDAAKIVNAALKECDKISRTVGNDPDPKKDQQ